MFSGGEKKSFYELSFVIGSGIIALKLKINRFTSEKIVYFQLPLLFLRSKQLEVRFFSSLEGVLYPGVLCSPNKQ